jgi:hypothetical protein
MPPPIDEETFAQFIEFQALRAASNRPTTDSELAAEFAAYQTLLRIQGKAPQRPVRAVGKELPARGRGRRPFTEKDLTPLLGKTKICPHCGKRKKIVDERRLTDPSGKFDDFGPQWKRLRRDEAPVVRSPSWCSHCRSTESKYHKSGKRT